MIKAIVNTLKGLKPSSKLTIEEKYNKVGQKPEPKFFKKKGKKKGKK